MFASERQEKILRELDINGSVKVKELSALFHVSDDCIRKDLSLLENQGLLQKAYGGAMKIKQNPHLYKIEDRMHTPNHQRLDIAHKVFDEIKEKDVIFLDISLSNIEVAKIIAEKKPNISVVTNMIEVLYILSSAQFHDVVFIGGKLNDECDGFVGSLSIEWVSNFKFDIAFLGVVGIENNHGDLSTYHVDDGLFKKKVIGSSRCSYLLCEDKKFNEEGQFVFGNISEINGMIVSNDLDHHIFLDLKEKGITVI